MAATIVVQRMTGVTPTYTTVTDVRLRTDDANTADNTNPVPIDTVLRRSYWASICLDISGTFTQVSNIRHHCDAGGIGWNFGTAGKLKRGNRDTGDHGVPDGSYVQATGTVGLTGTDLETGHTYYSAQTVKSANLNSDNGSGNAKVIDSSVYSSASKTKHIVLQVEVDTDATQGVQTAETLTWLVDEI